MQEGGDRETFGQDRQNNCRRPLGVVHLLHGARMLLTGGTVVLGLHNTDT